MSYFEDDSEVHGLVDSRRAAALLGVSPNVFKVWASRAKTSTSGIAASMPTPVATMHGKVYRVEDIEEFGRQIALMTREPRTLERATGRYFTPNAATEFMVQWALRSEEEIILEPSVGDGQFAAAAQQFALSRRWHPLEIHACELDAETAYRVVDRGLVRRESLHIGDFLGANALPMVDVVLGNPPYVRVRELESSLRRNARYAAESALGAPMDPAGSTWVPFVAKATTQLKAGGRLAFVLPLDFTYVRYARQLWSFLAKSFGKLQVVRFRERIFPDILQNVLILFAEDRGGYTDSVEQIAYDRVADIPQESSISGPKVPVADIVNGSRSFQYALLPARTREVLGLLEPHSTVARNRVKFNIGYVSGSKKFFHPSDQTVAQYKLPPDSLLPTVETSRQLSQMGLKTSTTESPTALWLPSSRLTPGEQLYVATGEEQGVDMAYKCRIRKPWYRVPGVRVPDLLLTTFSDRPRLHLNDAGWVASNSILCGFIRPNESTLDIVNAWYTPLTLLSAELQIHSLGGGVMIAVPNEADSVKILNYDSALDVDHQMIDVALRSGDVATAYSLGAKSIERLVGMDGVDALKSGAEILGRWRKSQV